VNSIEANSGYPMREHGEERVSLLLFAFIIADAKSRKKQAKKDILKYRKLNKEIVGIDFYGGVW
jgi:hypothetical protein